ncbi:MAG: mechanosensitive ion channel family protein [Bacteroidetes bacterium]|jgi:small conductance mechanosensitive channel|nr:mechanosensitive ion channel family protein [Bacteroidota bacterium]
MPTPTTPPSNITDHVIHKVGLLEEYSTKIVEWAKVFIPQLFFALITLFVGLWLIKKIAYLAVKAMERRNIEVSLRTFLKSLIGIGLKVILFIMVAGMIGVQTTSFVAILGAAGLAVGLALQGSLGNFAGGVLILVFKPYRVGDTIEAQGQKGEVKEIQIFNTILITGDHKTIILPNGAVSNGFIINHTKYGSIRTDIEISVSDMHPIEEVKTILRGVVAAEKRVLPLPAPSIGFLNYCPGGYFISIKVFSLPADSSDMKGDLMESIKKTFDEKQIEGPRTTQFVKQL